jgi:hypothetical protein
VTHKRLACDLDEANAADLRRSAGKALIDYLFANADRLKYLRTVIAPENADPHLRHDLEQSAFEGGAHVERRFLEGQRFGIFQR